MIKEYYNGLKSKKERKQFRLEVMLKTGIGYGTFFSRLREGDWTPAEKFTIKYIIDNETWRPIED